MRRVLLASAVIAGLSLSGSVTLAADERESFEVAHGNSPRIGADANGHIHVVYQAELKDSDIEHVFYRRSDDHGKTWTEPKDISQIKDGAASHARIAIEKDGAVDVVWLDTIPGEKENDVFFVRSADGGKTWGTPIDVSCTPGASSEPCIAVGPDGNVHVAWVDGPAKSAEIFYAVSDDHGSSWSKGYDVSHTPGTSSSPAIAVSGEGTVHVSWVDTTSGVKHPDIFYARKPAKGDWTKSINVSNSAHVSAQPAIAAVKGDKAYLVWSDNSAKENASDIWCAVGKDGKFESPLNLSNSSGISSEPTIFTDGERVAVAWTDTSTKKPDIMGRVGSNGKFSNVLNFTNTPDVSNSPHVTIGGDRMYLVWEEIGKSKDALRLTSNSLDVPAGQVFAVEQNTEANAQ